MDVYFIKTGDTIKVGIASNINRRMVELQVGNPHKIELLHTISTSEENAERSNLKSTLSSIKQNLNGGMVPSQTNS
jgi:hypothetical protein